MFQDLNPLDKSTAVWEIFIMLLVAFLLGWLFAKFCKCPKSDCNENACDATPAPAPAPKKAAPKPAAKKAAPAKKSDFAASLSMGAAKAGAKDDLKKIKGVGPVIEKKLNGLGIKTYEQVSKVTKADALKIDEAIEFFPGRIDRDDWKGQAKKLMK